MKAITIGYHDVVEDTARVAAYDPRPQALLYALSESDFAKHLWAVRYHAYEPGPVTIRCFQKWDESVVPVFLTFDDGAVNAYTCIAEQLEHHRWRGHFFVATDWIGLPGFLNATQIRELHQRGHVIGSHSCSHPERMSSLNWDELVREWGVSCARLREILGEPVKVASVPNGYYSPAVGHAAAAAGIEVLFTSEPSMAVSVVDGCLVLGRYAVKRQTPPKTSGDLAGGRVFPRWRQALLWQGKKAVKTLTGESYLRVRRFLLARGDHKAHI
jgi:peptidoglycan/xylan/chitin deacetylase (PgdA/CDA1 family)